MVLDNTSPSNT